MTTSRALIGLLVLAVIGLSLSLMRVDRDFAPKPGRPSPADSYVALGSLRAGSTPLPVAMAPPGYREDAASISSGQSAYETFNCVGCHQHGGGGIGPALMDDEWLYGSSPKEIFQSISEGRPNGMPAFRDRIPEAQLWQLVSYVRALGGLVPSVRLPARTDHMQATPPMSMQEQQVPTSGPRHPDP